MTVNKLRNILNKIIADGHGRADVAVNKETFVDNREGDGVCILPISGVSVRAITLADDDGGTKMRADGSECYRTTAILFGSAGVDGLIDPCLSPTTTEPAGDTNAP